MKSNLTLIGMPGSGKSTVGIILAKCLSFGFIDTDILIQINHGESLQDIIHGSDYLNLRKIEEDGILKINIDKHVIATGGSAVYSEKAMFHLQNISNIIYLDAAIDVIQNRIYNFETRGIAKSKTQTFQDLFDERQALYRKYAEFTVDCNKLNQEEVAELIFTKLANQF